MAFKSARQRKAVMSKLKGMDPFAIKTKRIHYVKPSKEQAKKYPTILKALSRDELMKRKVGDKIAFSDFEGKPVKGVIVILEGSFAKGKIAYANILMYKPLSQAMRVHKYKLKYNPERMYGLEIVGVDIL